MNFVDAAVGYVDEQETIHVVGERILQQLPASRSMLDRCRCDAAFDLRQKGAATPTNQRVGPTRKGNAATIDP